jgi:dihydropteroate synthase
VTTPGLFLEPLGLGDAVPGGLALCGGPVRFDRVRAGWRDGAGRIDRSVVPVHGLADWASDRGLSAPVEAALAALTTPRAAFAGLSLVRPLIMGIVNVTPDSFSDGGEAFAADDAVARGRALRAAGADILDIGGESTRPGSDEVDPTVEGRRVVPVIRALAADGATISVDTRHASVMAAALAAGARIVNDVTALRGDPASLDLVARAGCPVVLMHMRGEPKTMQDAPVYDDVVLDVHDRLAEDVARCGAAGIPRDRIALDPGIGFGKTVEHNLALIRHAAAFHDLGCALLYGVSRKRFVGTLDGGAPVKARLAGSLAAGLAAFDRGVHILRVHDVAETRQARAVWQAVRVGGGG